MKRLIDFIWMNRASLIIFLVVGGLTSVIYFLLFGLLWDVLGINYRLGVFIAYILSTAFHFFANRRFTFKKQNDHWLGQAKKYIGMVIFNYIETYLIVSFVVETLKLSPYLGIFASISATIATTYLISYFWVFKASLQYSRR